MQPRWKYGRPSLRTWGALRLVPVGRSRLSEVPTMRYGWATTQVNQERRSMVDRLRLAPLLFDSVGRLMALSKNWRPPRSSRSTTGP
jgi:hypothetical protein